MADLSVSIPDAQLEAFDIYIGLKSGQEPNSTTEGRVAAVSAWLQSVMNNRLWEMARSNASNAVSDPTV